jgi:hypothetical protein
MFFDDKYIETFNEPSISWDGISLPELNYVANSQFRAKNLLSFIFPYHCTRDIVYISICFRPFETKINLFGSSQQPI